MEGIRPVTVRDVTGMPRGALTGTNVKGALPPGKVTPSSALSTTRTNPTAIPGLKHLPPGQGAAFNPQVQAKTKVLEPLEIGKLILQGIDRLRVDGGGESSVDRGSNQRSITWKRCSGTRLLRALKKKSRSRCKTSNSCYSKRCTRYSKKSCIQMLQQVILLLNR